MRPPSWVKRTLNIINVCFGGVEGETTPYVRPYTDIPIDVGPGGVRDTLYP